MMKLIPMLMVGVLMAGGVTAVRAQDAAAEKAIIANERAINDAVAKGNLAGFTQYVATDGWAIDPASGRGPIADFVKGFDAMVKDTKMSSWDISDDKVQWVDANTAVHTYKWTGNGTYKGQRIPSPTWASTVWTKKSGKWTAVFHHESLETPPAQK
jgi:hypothetical protein